MNDFQSHSDVNLQLQRLIQRLQQQQIERNDRDKLLDELTEKICQSEQLAYPPRETLTPGFYQDCCQQALQATLREIRQKIESCNAKAPLRWVNRILERQFNEVVRAYQSDRQLQQLAQKAQQHPPKSLERQRALNDLVNLIRQSKRIGHPQQSLWTTRLYEELHSEALQETLIVVCQKIDTYNPDYPVMAWVNIILERRFSDVVKKYRRVGRTNLSKEEEVIPIFSSDDLDTDVLIDNESSNTQQVRDFLRDDPENLLRSSHVKNRPHVTFQIIIWAKFVDDKTWEDMAKELDIPVPTLSSFYQRTLHKLMPYLQKYLRE